MRSLRQRLKSRLLVAMIVATFTVTFAARPASAIDRDVKTVLKYGGIGILAGTGVGLITWPFTQDLRAVFMGTSIGLYLGIAVGIFQVLNRDNPQNPLNQVVYADPASRFIPESQKLTGAGGLYQLQAIPQPQFKIEMPILRF